MKQLTQAALLILFVACLTACGDVLSSTQATAAATEGTAAVKSVEEAYAKVAAEHGLTIGATGDEACSMEDIVGDETPELIIWWGRTARGGLLSEEIYGYDAATGEAFLYGGETGLHLPAKGLDGSCISESWDNYGVAYSIYQSAGRELVLVLSLEENEGALMVNGQTVDRDTFFAEAQKYIPEVSLKWHDEEYPIPPSGQQLELSNEELKDLNIFLSNFIEANFWEYQAGVTGDEDLIRFAMLYNQINFASRFSYADIDGISYTGTDSVHVIDAVKRFFNREVTLFSFGYLEARGIYSYVYQDGMMYVEAAGGDQFNQFAQVSGAEALTDGSYRVDFAVYTTEYEAPASRLYAPVSTWTAADHSEAWSTGLTGTAIVNPVVLNNRETYQLKELSVK